MEFFPNGVGIPLDTLEHLELRLPRPDFWVCDIRAVIRILVARVINAHVKISPAKGGFVRCRHSFDIEIIAALIHHLAIFAVIHHPGSLVHVDGLPLIVEQLIATIVRMPVNHAEHRTLVELACRIGRIPEITATPHPSERRLKWHRISLNTRLQLLCCRRLADRNAGFQGLIGICLTLMK